jgi:hypothetical protein
VPLQSDPVVMSRGGINFTLCTRQALGYNRIGKHFQCPSLKLTVSMLKRKANQYPVFTDRHGNAIGNIAVDVGHIETVDPNVELPGVHLPEVGESAAIPGVYTDQEPKLPEPNVDVGINFDNPAPQELPLVEVGPIQANDVVRRSTRDPTKPVYYQPTMTGQKYSFATTQLGKSLLKDDTYQNDPVVAFTFMQQMSLKAALKQ